MSSEPAGRGKAKRSNNPIFVIHQHRARLLHYDFRLEVDGVLKLWAIPKGPSTIPKERRLAVQVEDHLLGYVDFEGVIPDEEYDGGQSWFGMLALTVTSDRMTAVRRSRYMGQIEVWLEGKKLRGG